MKDAIYINCNLCGQNDYQAILRKGIPFNKPIRNVICKNCGLVYQNPIMGPKTLNDYYADYRNITIGLKEPTEEYEKHAKPLAKYHYSFFREYCKPGMNILDIGCGAGTLMSWAALDGLNTYGINPDPGFANYGLAHYGLKEVQVCLFEDASFPPNMFDIVTLNHVFEHFTDATSALIKIRSYLKNGGLLYLSIPNLLTPHGQIEYNFFLEHVNTFSVRTINLMLKKMGFKIIKLSTFGYTTESNLHHPYIDLIAKKTDVSVPQPIDWLSEGEDYKNIISFFSEYRKEFCIKHGKVKVFLGGLKRWLFEYVKYKPWFEGISKYYQNHLLKIVIRYAHTEPDYCAAPLTDKFPADKCTYY